MSVSIESAAGRSAGEQSKSGDARSGEDDEVSDSGSDEEGGPRRSGRSAEPAAKRRRAESPSPQRNDSPLLPASLSTRTRDGGGAPSGAAVPPHSGLRWLASFPGDELPLPPTGSPEYGGEEGAPSDTGGGSPEYKRAQRVRAPLGEAGHSVHERLFALALERTKRGARQPQRRDNRRGGQQQTQRWRREGAELGGSPEARRPQAHRRLPPQAARKRQWGILSHESARNLWQRAGADWRGTLRSQMRQMADILGVLLRELRTRRQPQTLSLTLHYLWRFYHGTGTDCPPHPFEEFDRRLMMCACLFLASKNENSRFPLGDLVIKVFRHEPSTDPGSDYHKRWRQITQAELYLIAVVLRFDFSFQDPQKAYAEILAKITGLSHLVLVGLHGVPWVIGGLRCFPLVFRTPLCLHYEPAMLARGMLRMARDWWTQRFGDSAWISLQSATGSSSDRAPITVDEELWEQETRLPEEIWEHMKEELDAVGLGSEMLNQYDSILQRQSKSRARSSTSAHGASPYAIGLHEPSMPGLYDAPSRLSTPTPPVLGPIPLAASPPLGPLTPGRGLGRRSYAEAAGGQSGAAGGTN
eukprot:TRINITY_DN12623_c0_g1_i1.p1 TRINITY_DN12623_c0_g1~~TRINITY_DN12623_c0_g1_i1.p1  ORF type:complete len:584 (+),score=128.54 TRINITY_DN12623_c0_g1_i1:83-1834(+)